MGRKYRIDRPRLEGKHSRADAGERRPEVLRDMPREQRGGVNVRPSPNSAGGSHRIHVRRQSDPLLAVALSMLANAVVWLQLGIRSPMPAPLPDTSDRLAIEFVDAKLSPPVSTRPNNPAPRRAPRPAARRHAKPLLDHTGSRADPNGGAPASSANTEVVQNGESPASHGTPMPDAWSVPPDGHDFQPSIMGRTDGPHTLSKKNVLPGVRVRDNSLAGRWQRLSRLQDCRELRNRLQTEPGSAEAILVTMQRRGCISE